MGNHLATLATYIIYTKYNLNMQQYAPLFGILSIVFTFFENKVMNMYENDNIKFLLDDSIEFINDTFINTNTLLIALFICSIIMYNKRKYIMDYIDLLRGDYNVIHIYTNYHITKILNLYELTPESFVTSDIQYGNIIQQNKMMLSTADINKFISEKQFKIDEKVYFDLPRFGKGYLITTSYKYIHVESDKKDIIYSNLAIDMYLNKNYDVSKFNDDLICIERAFVAQKLQQKVYLERIDYIYKGQEGFSNITSDYINMTRIEFNKYKEEIPKKIFTDVFDDIVKYINNNIENQSNIIFYGPPGTGKSTMISGITTLFERTVVSCNLTNLSKRDGAYLFNHTYKSIFRVSPRSCALVLEEFDESVMQLYEREQALNAVKHSPKELVKYIKEVGEKTETLLTLKDLLNLFQGPFVNKGMIVLATTNNFDEIKEKLPALFRPGRLTPYYVGYINESELTRFLNYHYPDRDSKITWYKKHSIPTSQLTVWATTYKNDFNGFKKILENYINEEYDMDVVDDTILI
jgi:hypothetical protein